MQLHILFLLIAVVLCACSASTSQSGSDRANSSTRPDVHTPRPAKLSRLDRADRQTPITPEAVDITDISAGEPVTLWARSLQLHLRPNGQSYYSYSANPWNLADPCGATLCYTTPSSQLTDHGQIGNCWVPTGPTVNEVTITASTLCSQ